MESFTPDASCAVGGSFGASPPRGCAWSPPRPPRSAQRRTGCGVPTAPCHQPCCRGRAGSHGGAGAHSAPRSPPCMTTGLLPPDPREQIHRTQPRTGRVGGDLKDPLVLTPHHGHDPSSSPHCPQPSFETPRDGAAPAHRVPSPQALIKTPPQLYLTLQGASRGQAEGPVSPPHPTATSTSGKGAERPVPESCRG